MWNVVPCSKYWEGKKIAKSEMITKNTASNSSLATCSSILPAKDHKTNWQAMRKYELCMNAGKKKAVDQKSDGRLCVWLKKLRKKTQQEPGFRVSSQVSAGWCCFYLRVPGRMKASKFQHNEGVVVHVKDGKICLTKKVCKLPETRVECRCWQ